jgi:hypothetical protein
MNCKDEGGRMPAKDEGGGMKDEFTPTAVRLFSAFILHPSSLVCA